MDSQTLSNHHSSPSLLSIPVEVLLQITYNLTTPELGNLRRSCKQIESTLFPSFSREFFTKRQFMFTEFSLQALSDISKSRLSSCLSHVIFNLERPPPYDTHSHLPQTDMAGHIRSNRFLQESVSHMTLVNTGQDAEMISEAFSNLGNLETIGVRDFNSRSRRRDYPNIEWKSTYHLHIYPVSLKSHAPDLKSNLPSNTTTPISDAHLFQPAFGRCLSEVLKALSSN
jgi:hypothetical protein